MTRGGAIAAGLAGAVSIALHAGVLIAVAPEAPPSLAGGATRLAMVGNSFKDAAAGAVMGSADRETTMPVETPASIADAAAPPPVQAALPAAPAPPAVPSPPSAVVRPVASAAAAIAAVTGLPLSPTSARDLSGSAPVVPSPQDPAPAERPAASLAPTRPSALTPTASAFEATVRAHVDPVVRTPDPDSPRPRPRSARAAQAEPAKPPGQVPPQGGAAEPTRIGDAMGAAQGDAPRTEAGTGGRAGSDGRAAADYPQIVNRHLFRQRRPSTRFEGAAVVSFTIAANGGLAALSVARSSGDADFDRLVLAHVQRAAPFPPPPTGAQRRFSVTVKGR